MKEDIREDMKLGRTREGTIFEIVSALLIIIMWVVSMRLVSSHGADKEQMVINCVIATASVFAMLLASYRPAFLNIPVTITTPAQLRLLIRLERIAALEVIAILFGINLAMALTVEKRWFSWSSWPLAR